MLNGTRLKLIFSDYSPKLYFPFTISGLDLPFQPGNYHNQGFSIQYDSGKRSRVYGAASLTFGGEYMGNLLSLESELNYRHQHWGVLGITYSQQNLTGFPEIYGESNFTLIGSKLELSFSRSLFFTTFLQYNTQNENFNINSRFNWRFRPLSDLYIVYTENYSADKIGIKDRALVLKLTYWFNL